MGLASTPADQSSPGLVGELSSVTDGPKPEPMTWPALLMPVT